jgi:ATP-binding cassette subfamily F protein 3
LDEPTNHLDIPAAEILEEALIGFAGTVVFVSHDRRFLENVSTRTLAFTKGGLDLFEGGFKDYGDALERARVARETDRQPLRGTRRKEASPREVGRPAGADAKKKVREAAPEQAGADAHRTRREKMRDIERKTKEVALLEARSVELEAEVARYKKLLVEATGSDWEKLHEWAKKERELSHELSKVLEAWLSLSEELGQKDTGEPEPG